MTLIVVAASPSPVSALECVWGSTVPYARGGPLCCRPQRLVLHPMRRHGGDSVRVAAHVSSEATTFPKSGPPLLRFCAFKPGPLPHAPFRLVPWGTNRGGVWRTGRVSSTQIFPRTACSTQLARPLALDPSSCTRRLWAGRTGCPTRRARAHGGGLGPSSLVYATHIYHVRVR